MFKNVEKISKCMDQLIKVAEDLNQERKEELTEAIHKLSIVHQNVLGDMTKNSHNRINSRI